MLFSQSRARQRREGRGFLTPLFSCRHHAPVELPPVVGVAVLEGLSAADMAGLIFVHCYYLTSRTLASFAVKRASCKILL